MLQTFVYKVDRNERWGKALRELQGGLKHIGGRHQDQIKSYHLLVMHQLRAVNARGCGLDNRECIVVMVTRGSPVSSHAE